MHSFPTIENKVKILELDAQTVATFEMLNLTYINLCFYFDEDFQNLAAKPINTPQVRASWNIMNGTTCASECSTQKVTKYVNSYGKLSSVKCISEGPCTYLGREPTACLPASRASHLRTAAFLLARERGTSSFATLKTSGGAPLLSFLITAS